MRFVFGGITSTYEESNLGPLREVDRRDGDTSDCRLPVAGASWTHLQTVVAEVTKVLMRAARFVTSKAAHTPVGGLPLKSGVGGLDFGDDVAPRELGGTGALLQSVDGVKHFSPARTAR